ncbi:MAG: hypothetical protein PF572_04875 [Patescibacteria group bacterium]|jgi:hypothetical protein|nr:hypothetical protein [Patescibacteria group bacterium]
MKAKQFFIVNLVMFVVASLLVLGLGIFVFMQMQKVNLAEAADDETTPDISEIVVSDVTATSTLIKWKTDEETDSLINYGLDKNYGVSRSPHFDKTEHEILLADLIPNMQYFFRITSTDESGNQKLSNDFTFQTEYDRDYAYGNLEDDILSVCSEMFGDDISGVDQEGNVKIDVDMEQLEEVEEIEEKELLMQILEKIEQVQEEKTLEIIEEHIQAVAEDVASELSIILDNANIEVGTDYAIIYWQTNKEANSIVSLALDETFNYEADDPYTWNEGEPDETVLEHRIEITGLEPATTYHFQVSSKTILDQEAKSSDGTFMTKSVLPIIQNLSLSKVEETSATIAFSTNIPTAAIIEYTNLNTGESKLEGQSAYLSSHMIKLNNLIFDTYYSVVVTVENEQNEKSVSDPLTFITTRDAEPPLITKVNTESTLYPGSDNKVQTIISYETDEASKCQLNYHRGIVSLDGDEILPEEKDYVSDHVQVVTNFLPANVYKFWIVCHDDAQNMAKSQDFTMLTPSREESIIDIILKNFEGTFGWVKNIKM